MIMTLVKTGQYDPVWAGLREEVAEMAESENMLASYLHATVLNHKSLEHSLSFLLAAKLSSPHLSAMSLRDVIDEAFHADPEIGEAVRRDLMAVVERDPAARGTAQPFLYYKGFHALEAFRVSHWLWSKQRNALALHLQNRISEVFAVDIHPAAKIGKGILIDHATSVISEKPQSLAMMSPCFTRSPWGETAKRAATGTRRSATVFSSAPEPRFSAISSSGPVPKLPPAASF